MSCDSLPYAARPLTQRETTRFDVYLFQSPKAGRIASVVDPLRLAFWMEREFDPDTIAIVERPRTIPLADGRNPEADYWVRMRDGRENFWVAVGAEDTNSASTELASKDLPLWNRAAELAGIHLQFFFEHDLHRKSLAFSNHLRMLPQVQGLRVHPKAQQALRDVEGLFVPGIESLSFAQVSEMLPSLERGLATMASCSLIHAGRLTYEAALPVSQQTRIARPVIS